MPEPETVAIDLEKYDTDLSELTQGQFCDLYRCVVDEIEDINHKLINKLKAIKEKLQAEAIDRCNAQEIESMKGSRITLTVKDQPFVRFEEGADWQTILSELCASNYGAIVHRKITASKLLDISDAGFRLPDGLVLDQRQVCGHSRRN